MTDNTLVEPILVLASASARRSTLLAQLAVPHRVVPVEFDERALPGESPAALVQRLASGKATAAISRCGGLPVLAADTIVVWRDQVFGKPRDLQDAKRMLLSLSDDVHTVMTAVALAMPDGHKTEAVSVTRVYFGSLSEADVQRYWASGEPADKAGAYAIQGLAARYIKRIEGSYSGVMGLPLYETAGLLQRMGLLTNPGL